MDIEFSKLNLEDNKQCKILHSISSISANSNWIMSLARLHRNFLVAKLTISLIFIVNFSVINKQWYAYSFSSSRIHKQSIPFNLRVNYLRKKCVVALKSQLQSDDETLEDNNQYNTLPRLFVGNLQNYSLILKNYSLKRL